MFKNISALFLTLGLTSVAAAATTIDNAPGSACVATGGGSLNVRDDGELENTSSTAVTAICPVERPIETGNIATSLAGKVFVVDQNSTYDVCCQAVSKNPGGVKILGTQACSSSASASFQILDLPALTDGFTFSAFYLQCTLPPAENGAASRIQVYRSIQK
jgi:hypothetical protein